MLRQRIITAIVLAIVVVGSILQADTLWTRVLLAFFLFAASWELILLTLRTTTLAAVSVATLYVALYWWSGSVVSAGLVLWQSLAGVALWALVLVGLFFYRHSGSWPLMGRVVLLAVGLDLLWICVHGLLYLHATYGGVMLLYLLSLVWVADIGAYFSGRRFGRNKLAPAISPGKTREGLIGGLLANLLWMLVVYWISQGWGIALLPFLLVGVATSLISVVGDLFESVLKREAGVKDSGSLLPGHGGVLDRVDSLIAATPVYVSGLIFAGQL
ncbi:MAG: phosphatidate cytidylyltransferase [Gammaproteobacteria bacterium]|jgi:phosphatidate cytidylyltransferase|nr:phosphatidate cytidylyltransferase [Gammaproteobacteria bacterium]